MSTTSTLDQPGRPRPSRVWSWLDRLFCHQCARTLEAGVALLTLATGLWLLWPADTFASAETFRAFRVLGDVPAGALLIALALLVLVGPHSWRTPAVWALGMVWSYTAWLFGLGNPDGVGWLWASSYAAGAFYALLSWRHWEGGGDG